ncbi:hypothetical protein SPWS13_4555 [Shewanella putrefaciens]|nr:hypothetical protein SPWS13_4555 [Shewanella putrefaciens]
MFHDFGNCFCLLLSKLKSSHFLVVDADKLFTPICPHSVVFLMRKLV